MDETERSSANAPTTGSVMGRRAFFRGALLAAGAAATLAGLTGCPGGDGDDDGDDDGGDDD
jgi:hypothetical protein